NAGLSEDNIKAMDRLKDKKIEDQKAKLASQWNLVTNPKDSNSVSGNSDDAKKKMWLVDQPVVIHGAQKYEEPQGAKTARDYIQNHLGGNRPYGMSPAMKAQQAKKLAEAPQAEKSELSLAQKEKLIGEFKSFLLNSKAYAKSQLTEIDNKKK
ncbi:MAG: hypothetical protein PHN49_00860, partial [Candidatus Omnitrophica bacterium]|nr:hypothetical protein [Candidatus Omnitrophota bacterium]